MVSHTVMKVNMYQKPTTRTRVLRDLLENKLPQKIARVAMIM